MDEHEAAHEPGKEKDKANPGAGLSLRNETQKRNRKAKAITKVVSAHHRIFPQQGTIKTPGSSGRTPHPSCKPVHFFSELKSKAVPDCNVPQLHHPVCLH